MTSPLLTVHRLKMSGFWDPDVFLVDEPMSSYWVIHKKIRHVPGMMVRQPFDDPRSNVGIKIGLIVAVDQRQQVMTIVWST